MAFKAPKGTTFTAQGDAHTVIIREIETDVETEVSAQYGLLVEDEGGAIKGSRFVVSRTDNIMGREVELSAGAADVTKALDAFVEGEMRASVEDFEYDGTDDEYFSQKYSAPKEDKDDVWKSDKFKDKLDDLMTLAAEAEEGIAVATDDEKEAQDARRKLGFVIQSAYEAVGRSRKALKVWSQGADGEGGNFKLLAQLGKGENALTEAMRLAQITDTEYAVLPVGITSGKGVDRHVAQSIKAIVDQSDMNKLKGIDVMGDRPDISGVSAIIRHIAKHGFGVADAADMDDEGDYLRGIATLTDAVDEAAAAWVAEYNDKYGKHINTYNANEYDANKRAFGAVRVSTAGAGVFADAVSVVTKYAALDDDDAEGMKKLLDSAFSKTGGNALLKEGFKAAKAHAEAVAREQMNRKAVQAVTSDDAKAVISATAKKQFSALDPLAAAAEMYALIQTHQAPEKVEAALKSLMTQAPTIKAVAAE